MDNAPDISEIDREITALRERLEDAEELRRAICDGEVEALIVGREEGKVHMLVPQAVETEAAATLKAIHRGEVDAFVVAGERVVTLSSALSPYQILADRMQQGAATLSAEGEILYANERLAAAMLRKPRTEVLGASLETFVIQQDRGALAACLVAGRKGNAQCEIRLAPGVDGTPVNVLLSVNSLGSGQVICLFSDISLQKRHAATDERTRKFLSMLAHEFRGMLATIGYSAAFLKAGTTLEPKAREAVETIERQTQRLSALVEDLRSVNPKE